MAKIPDPLSSVMIHRLRLAPFCTRQEAAALLRTTEEMIDILRRTNVLPYVKLGRLVRLPTAPIFKMAEGGK